MPARLTDADLIATHAEWLRQGRDAAKVAAILGLSARAVCNRLGIAVRRGLVVIEGPLVALTPTTMGRMGGQVGGKARAAKLTQEQRSEIARQGAAKRWAGHQRIIKGAVAAGTERPTPLPASPAETLSIDELWTAYTSTCATDTHKLLSLRNRIAEHYWPTVLKFVRNFCFNRKLTEAGAIESAASEALLLAIPKFEPARGYQFMSFFGQRLNGAMLDECRNQDYASRVQRAR